MSDKPKLTTNTSVKSAKSFEDGAVTGDSNIDNKTDKPQEPKESKETVDVDSKEGKNSKRRKVNSRTPTPVSGIVSESVSVTAGTGLDLTNSNTEEKKDISVCSESVEKTKKVSLQDFHSM